MKHCLTLYILIMFACACVYSQPYAGKRLAPARQTESLSVFNVSDNGGVVVSVIDGDEERVVCYTDKGNYTQSMQNPIFAAIISNLEVSSKRRRAIAFPLAQPKKLRAEIAASKEEFPASVAPLLTDLWHQYYEPYNWLAPKIDSLHCVSGCVAMAMAQVLHYWRYPEHGYSTHTYVDSLGCGQTLTCDFSSHYYDWDNMLNEYEHTKYTDIQGYAVAQLMYDCGVSVNMKYTIEASGASSIRQPIALQKHFGYDKSTQMHYRDFYTIEQWTSMLKHELAHRRPVLMSGYNYRLGHAFVCDGYDENDYFHFSFGNPDGLGDGYFYLPYLTPDILPEQDKNSPESGFNLLQSMVTNVMPSTHPEATGLENHLFSFSSIQPLGADSIIVNRLGNVGWNLHSDSVAIALQKDGKIVSFPYTYTHDFLLEEIDDTVYTDTIQVPLLNVADGAYKLVPMFRDNQEWKEAHTSIGVPNYLILQKSGKKQTISADSLRASYLTLEAIDFPDWIKSTGYPDYSLTVKNHNSEFCGRIYILLENQADSSLVLLQEQGLTLAPEETATYRFHTTWRSIPSGTYNLCVYWDQDLFSSDIETFTDLPLPTVVVSSSRPVGIESIELDSAENDANASVNSSTSANSIPFTLSGIPVWKGYRGVRIVNKKKTLPLAPQTLPLAPPLYGGE